MRVIGWMVFVLWGRRSNSLLAFPRDFLLGNHAVSILSNLAKNLLSFQHRMLFSAAVWRCNALLSVSLLEKLSVYLRVYNAHSLRGYLSWWLNGASMSRGSTLWKARYGEGNIRIFLLYLDWSMYMGTKQDAGLDRPLIHLWGIHSLTTGQCLWWSSQKLRLHSGLRVGSRSHLLTVEP